MAIFVDNFTGVNATLLQNHTPDTGTSWSSLWQSTAGEDFEITTNQCAAKGSTNDGNMYTANNSYPSADYYIQCTLIGLGTAADDSGYLHVRIQDVDNLYSVRLCDQNGQTPVPFIKR